MFFTEAGCLFWAFVLCLSGVQGKPNSICALKGSSVKMRCSDQRPTTSMNWYTAYRGGSKIQPSADETHAKYNISADSSFTLTINRLTESDANIYCCSETAEKPDNCQQSGISLRVAELQVKVIPATEGQTVTLMCSSSSCPLTKTPAAYIWYKNREFLYEDWSPWYQELLSSEEAVTYSCAVKGYEDLRAPEVSVDSITPTCLNVTSAYGEMCSYCSITYPREVHVVRTPGNTLTCSTTCPLTDPQTAYVWFRNGQKSHENQRISTPASLNDNLYCVVKGQEHLQSDQICVQDKNCWRVNYVSRRICALEGSSVNIISEYSHPDNMKPENKFWTKKWRFGDEKVENLIASSGRVEYHDNMKNQHILTIKNLTKNDSAEYTFRLKKEHEDLKQPDQPGVILIVTDLRVEMSPSAVVTEAQRVTLTCRTSCPLTHNTNYIWYLNNQPVNLTETQNKHLILDPVSRESARNYSCAVETNTESFTGKWLLVAAGAFAALLLIIIIILLTACWRRRKKRTSSPYPRSEISDSKQEVSLNPTYDNASARYSRMQATLKCPAELYSNAADIYSNTAGIYSNTADIYSNAADIYSNIVELYSNPESPSFD